MTKTMIRSAVIWGPDPLQSSGDRRVKLSKGPVIDEYQVSEAACQWPKVGLWIAR